MKGCHHCKYFIFDIDIEYEPEEYDVDIDVKVNIECERGHFLSDLTIENDIRDILIKGDKCKDFEKC